MAHQPSQDEINAAQAQTNLSQAQFNAATQTDIAWIKKIQWWQIGLLTTQLAATAAVASKVMGGPGPTEVSQAAVNVAAAVLAALGV